MMTPLLTRLTAANVFVPASGDLQAAFNQAQAGDTITLQAGATFIGNYTVPPNHLRQWITIQSSAMANLPGLSGRVTPNHAPYMPKIITPNAGTALLIPSGANYYCIQGIEFSVGAGVYVNDLVEAGFAGEAMIGNLPHHLIFDRDYLHGDPNSGGKRGIALNSATTVIRNSYFEAFTSDWQDTQAICGWNGPGPFTITNNHLEAGTEIVAFGGATPAVPGMVPSNIIIENNDFYKPLNWWSGSANYIGRNIRAKNHLELKNAKNVLIQNNSFNFNFLGADQFGFMLVFGVRDENGTVPWATVSNVYVTHNQFEHTAAGVLFMGHDGDGGGTAGNINLSNNTWLDVGGYGGDGRMYEILNDVRGITIDHETAFPTGWLMVFAQGPSSNLHVTNSIFAAGWGIGGTGYGAGNGVLDYYEPGGTISNTLIVGGWSYGFTGSHFLNDPLPGSLSDVGFVNVSNNDYRLVSNSPYRGEGLDGLNPGSTLVTSGTAAADYAPDGWVTVVSKQSGKCMDLATWTGSNWGQNSGTPINQYDCHDGDMQKFQFTSAYTGYKVTVKLSGQQWDVAGGNQATHGGEPLIQYPYWGGANEEFTVSPARNGYITIHTVLAGLCLGLADDSDQNGVPIQQQACTGSDDQLWRFIPAQ